MAATTAAAPRGGPDAHFPQGRPTGRVPRYAGLFLLALATLLLELSLTRVLSVALWYHFGFLVISTALLGFGTSGVFLALSPRLREQAGLDTAVALCSGLFGIATVGCFWLLQRIPADPFGLLADWRQALFMPAYYLTIAVPFFFAGLAIALLLSRETADVNRLYAADLTGAGLGCASVAVVMPLLGGSGSVVFAGALGLLAAAVFFGVRRPRAMIAAGMLATITLGLSVFADRVLPIRVTANKRWHGRPLYTAWNTFSRVDVVERPADPSGAQPAERGFIIDAGTAATGVSDLRPDVRTAIGRGLEPDPTDVGIAFVGKPHPRVLVIGSGAGDEVVRALRWKAASVTAVEINPIMRRVMTEVMPEWWGGLWSQPGVTLVVDEGRTFVRRSREVYDAIVSRHTISNAAVASGALSLTENFVLTREAFDDYLERLSPDGVLYFTRPEAQVPRLFATAREVFDQRGLGPVADHLYAFKVPNDPARQIMRGRASFIAGFLLRKTPYAAEDVRAIEQLIRVGEPAKPGGTTPERLYAPGVAADSIYRRLVTATDIGSVYRNESAEIAPATDDRPFFNHHTRWSALRPASVRDLFTQGGAGRLALEDRPVAEVTLLALLLQVTVLSAALIVWPLLRFSRQGLRAPRRLRYLTYFGALGLGFIMVEMAFLHRFTLYLGQPVSTFAVVLASLLAFTGLGSGIAGRFTEVPRAVLAAVVPVLILVLVLTTLVMGPLFEWTLGAALPWRVAIAILLVAPVGTLLGMPFPTGLRAVSAETPSLVPWAWGVNGFFTVIGSVATLMLAMTFGFRLVLALAAACYLVAYLALARRRGSPAQVTDVT